MLRRRGLAGLVFALFLFVPVARAAVVAKVSDDALAPMRNPTSRHVRIDGLPIYDSMRSVIELEEFEVWAPGAKIVVHSPEGVVEMDPPATRFFRGMVNDDPESFAYFAVDQQSKRVDGLIVTRDKRFALRSDVRPAAALHPARAGEVEFDQFLTEIDGEELNAEGTMPSWECAVDRMKMRAPEEPEHAVNVTADGKAVAQGITGTQSYAITLKIETDFELYQNAGSNLTTLTNYVTNLTGALATIYMRDLNIEVTQSMISMYTTEALDPWESTDANNGLDELGDEYHFNVLNGTTGIPNNRTSSAVMLLSGVDYGGGVAWEGVICRDDFFQGGHWGGPYGWSGGIGKLFGVQGLGSIPNPDSTVSGTLYGMPSGTQNFWPLTEYTHELGHNLGGHHTHCTQVTAGEFSASGFTTGELTVDHCYGHEDFNGIGTVPDFPACFNGADYAAGSPGIFKGTIMSYCHNVFPGGIPQSRFTFGLPSEPSHHQLDDYMLRAGGPIQVSPDDGRDGGSRNIVNGVGAFTMTVNVPANVAPGSTGNAASITASPSTGATYVWSVSNGTLTSGQGTAAITFTAGASGDVVVKATAFNDKRCGIVESKNVPITAVVVDAPTGVVATATSTTSVDVSWNAVSGATSYNVWRMIDAWGSMQFLGNTAALTFTDSTAAPSTAYLYIVSAMNGATSSASSVADIATTIMFTDPTITPDLTPIKAVHFEQLRLAVNAARVLGGNGTLAPITFSPPSPDGLVTIRANHVQQLRTGLNEARGMMGISQVVFSDPTLTAGTSVVQSPHITELRGGVE